MDWQGSSAILNKRSDAFLFVDFLHRNGRLLNNVGDPVVNDTGLAALTLLVAESDPKQKGNFNPPDYAYAGPVVLIRNLTTIFNLNFMQKNGIDFSF